jgi:hypothetical protein
MPTEFPIMNEGFPLAPSSVPWEFVAPFEAGAQRNHSQSLARLAERGGLSVYELLAIIENTRWKAVPPQEAVAKLKGYLSEFESKRALKWTKELPTKEGAYWFRTGADAPLNIRFLVKNGRDEFYVCYREYLTDTSIPLSRFRHVEYDWAGPISQPIN